MTSGTFAFRAVRRDGKLESGTVEAPSREAAIALIGTRGAFAVEVSSTEGPHARKLRMDADDLASGLRALSTLVGSGLPLARALIVLDALVPASWLPALAHIRRSVEQGGSLAIAMADSSLPLPPSVLGIIRAGESGSGLANALERTAKLLEARATTRAAIRNALAYPMLLGVAGSASIVLLLGVVLPRFADLLTDTGQSLPTTTRLVLGVGSVLEWAWIPALTGAVATIVSWQVWVTRPTGRLQWHRLLLIVPTVGPLRRSSATAAACSVLAALLESGVPIVRALHLAADATGDAAAAAALTDAANRIEIGDRVATALEAEGALTPAAVRMVRAGEESGQLAGMFAHAARIESRQALQRLQRSIRVIEPALILLFGGLVMVVAAAMLQAMYGLRPSF
jgi:general secretion pathway protein F